MDASWPRPALRTYRPATGALALGMFGLSLLASADPAGSAAWSAATVMTPLATMANALALSRPGRCRCRVSESWSTVRLSS